MRNFPHLNDSSFPSIDNVDVYKYANEFDYTRYDSMQMRLQMCSVPWDMGEAHIGNRTISGIGNVVYFENKAAREAWFDAIPDTECYRFETKFKELHRSNQIDVPVPFDVASKYNYLVVEYNLFANENSLVEYESADGLRRWYWFIREVEFVAPNSTKLHLMNDAWQTFIYDLDVTGMMLERGHAPMVGTSATKYLANPIGNNECLLHEDIVNENAAGIAYAAGELVFNAKNMKAVIISTANPVTGSFGSKAGGDWRCDGQRHFDQDGVPSYCAFACDAANLDTLISNIDSSYPQFAQTIQGVCFISGDMLNLGTSFTFANIACNLIANGYKSNTVITLNKSEFGYPAHYADIAKLYTYPYAYIELTDETGDITEIRIEQTDGRIQFDSCVNLVYPWLQISGHLVSSGRGSKRNISFRNITDKSMPVKGDWYKTVKSWDVPIFGITQDAKTHNDYNTHFDRAHDAVAYGNSYDSAIASADAMKTNAYSSAATAKTNTDRSATAAYNNANADADTTVAVSNLAITANDANAAANITKVTGDATGSNAYNYTSSSAANSLISATVNNAIDAQNQSTAISTSAGIVQTGNDVIASLGNPNATSAGAAMANIANAGVSAMAAICQNINSVNQDSANAAAQQGYNTGMYGASVIYTNYGRDLRIDNIEAIRDADDALTSGSAAATAATIRANATRSLNATTANTTLDKSTAEGIADLDNTTAKANAGRTRATAIDAIDKQIMQSGLHAPEKFGEFASGDSATTRPMGLFANVVTQDPYSIAYAGDEMLRYGYMYDRYWEFDGDWNVAKNFTYWKLSDFWVSNLNIPDMYVDRIRFFLFGGVTVWRRPEDIGKVDLYHNIDWS